MCTWYNIITHIDNIKYLEKAHGIYKIVEKGTTETNATTTEVTQETCKKLDFVTEAFNVTNEFVHVLTLSHHSPRLSQTEKRLCVSNTISSCKLLFTIRKKFLNKTTQKSNRVKLLAVAELFVVVAV